MFRCDHCSYKTDQSMCWHFGELNFADTLFGCHRYRHTNLIAKNKQVIKKSRESK